MIFFYFPTIVLILRPFKINHKHVFDIKDIFEAKDGIEQLQKN